MSIALSQFLQGEIMDWVKGGAMPAAPTSLQIGLLTSAPAHDGSGISEPNNLNGYSRQPVSFGATTVSAGVSSITTANSVVFGPVTGTAWGTVTHAAVFNADTGDMLFYGPLAASRTAPVGDSVSFGAGAIQFRLK